MATIQFSANCQAASALRSSGLASWGRIRCLPQNLVISSGSLITGSEAGFEDSTDWSMTAGAASDNTTQYVDGSQSLKLTMNNTANTLVASRTDLNEDLSGSYQIQVAVYVHTIPDTNFRIRLANDVGFANTAQAIIPCGSGSPAIHEQEIISGQWVTINLHRSEFTTAGSFSWGSNILAMRFYIEDTNQVAEISFDNFRVGVETLPAVMLETDDINDSDYTVVYQRAWIERVMRTSHACISGFMDGVSRLTTAQAQTMFNANLDICNHSDENASLVSYGNQADVETHVQACIDYLFNNGMCRAEYHLNYPQGGWDATVKAGIAAVGILTARNAYDADVQLSLPQYYWYNIKATPLERDNTTLNEATGYVDDALARNEIALIYTHDLSDAPTYYGWDDDDYESLLDYVVGEDIAVLTISDLWALTTGDHVVPDQHNRHVLPITVVAPTVVV